MHTLEPKSPGFLVFTFLAGAMLNCGPGEAAPDCVSVDERLGVPAERAWCEGEWYPEMWEGKHADKTLAMCLPPLANGECELCPTEKIIEEVEQEMFEYLAEYRPMCGPDHWEFGCMRTIENAMTELGRETNYCCFQVAVWGQGCADSGA